MTTTARIRRGTIRECSACSWSTDRSGSRWRVRIRYHRLSTELAGRFDVTLVAPGDGIPGSPYVFRSADSAGWAAPLDAADVVVAQTLPLGVTRKLRQGERGWCSTCTHRRSSRRPRAWQRSARSSGRRASVALACCDDVALLLGDAFVCASDRQRDHWLGALGALGRLSPDVYADDPTLRSSLPWFRSGSTPPLRRLCRT